MAPARLDLPLGDRAAWRYRAIGIGRHGVGGPMFYSARWDFGRCFEFSEFQNPRAAA